MWEMIDGTNYWEAPRFQGDNLLYNQRSVEPVEPFFFTCWACWELDVLFVDVSPAKYSLF